MSSQTQGPTRGVGRLESRTGDSVFLPCPARSKSGAEWTLPPHLQDQVADRLRNTALLYSAAFFLADIGPDVFTGQLAMFFRMPAEWIPTVTSILAGLDAVILRCLAKSPEHRPANARELGRLLSAVPLDDPWTEERAEAWWEEHGPAAPSRAKTGTPSLERPEAIDARRAESRPTTEARGRA